MIRNLIFDFGKVLVDYDYMQLFLQYFNTEAEAVGFAKCILTGDWSDRLDKEDIPMEDIIEEAAVQYPQYTEALRFFAQRFPDIVIGEMEGMRELLTKLKSEGYRLYGLTNWCHKCHITMERYDVFKLLDGVVISSEVHQIKPEKEIYLTLLNKYNLKAKECVFTDDKQVNIDGARRVGITSITFQNAKQYELELQSILSKQASIAITLST